MVSFCPNHIKFQLKKYRRVISHNNESDAKFKEIFSRGFNYDIRTLVNFHPTPLKSEHFFSMGFFCPKHTRFELQKYRRVTYHDTEQWCKIWINPDLALSKMAWGIGWTFIRALKSLKNCILMGSFCLKYIMFELKNYRSVMCYDTEGWCNI